MQIIDATNNLRASLKRMYKPEDSLLKRELRELSLQCGVEDASLKRFLDGGFLSDDDKIAVTNVLFPHLVFNAIADRFESKTVTYAILQATTHLRRLVQRCRDKSDLARKTKINQNKLDQFAEGQKDLTPDEKTTLATHFGMKREFHNDALVNLPATNPPYITPPDVVGRPWREQQVPTIRSV